MPDAARKERTPLTFTFKNIGPIEKADLELGDLTIVAGRNNTGKTYLVYTLYGFLKAWADWPGPSLTPARYRGSEPSRRSVRYPIFERISQQVQETGQAELPADRDALNGERNEALNALTHSFSKGPLARAFSSPLEEFKDASIGVKLNQEFPLHPRPVNGIEPEDELSIRYDGANLSVIATHCVYRCFLPFPQLAQRYREHPPIAERQHIPACIEQQAGFEIVAAAIREPA